MIAAGPTITETAQSLEQLILTAIPGFTGLPSNGRVTEIHIQWRVGSASEFHLVYKEGTTDIAGPTINLATDSGRIFDATDNYLEMRSKFGNTLSLREFFLVVPDGGSAVARILAWMT